MAGGRPTKYDPVFCEVFVEMSSHGCSRIEFCAQVGISYESFLAYQRRHPEFMEAVKRGLQLCQAWWERKGRENMGERDFNYTGWYMNMKNRFRSSEIPWSDSREIKHSGGVSMSKESDDELDNRIRSLMAADADPDES